MQLRLMHLRGAIAAAALMTMLGCLSAGPVVDNGPRPVGVGGTIAGTVSATGATAPLSGRFIRAINEASGEKFETSTSTNGSYVLKVPAATYRLEVELRPGEALQTRPEVTAVGVGDIDSGRDFILTVSRP